MCKTRRRESIDSQQVRQAQQDCSLWAYPAMAGSAPVTARSCSGPGNAPGRRDNTTESSLRFARGMLAEGVVHEKPGRGARREQADSDTRATASDIRRLKPL